MWLALLKVWDWCKINWKFVLGISIPIIISILMRRGNAAKIYRKASETRQKELELSKAVREMEMAATQDAIDDFDSSMQNIHRQHSEKLQELQERNSELLDEIKTAEDATAAIKDRLK
jgi:biopolymer transport protein ExbB/TolQ